jgi:hypothetical protein
MNRKPPKFFTSGVWSKAPDNPARPLCLGLLICKPIVSGALTSRPDLKTIAGIAGGYCGGDLFCLEQFVCETSKTTSKTNPKGEQKLSSLWVGSTDLLTGGEVDFNQLPTSVLKVCREALTECWEWNSENNYLESQQLRLYPYNLEGLMKTSEEDHLYYKALPKELPGIKDIWATLHQGLYLVQKSQNIPYHKTIEKNEKLNINIL